MNDFDKARKLLKEFKGDSYLYGEDVLSKVGDVAKKAGGGEALLIADSFDSIKPFIQEVKDSLKQAGITLKKHVDGPRPNAPVEDVYRLADEVKKEQPDIVISFGGGSTVDAGKAAEALRTLGGDLEDYFGTGKVTEVLEKTGKKLHPHIAIQAASSSGAQLTKYSNITNLETGQKKLIVDEGIVPQYPVFDYRVTHSSPKSLTMDGGLDGIAHMLEVLYGAENKPFYDKTAEIAEAGIKLILDFLPKVLENPKDSQAREAICLGTDLGGYAIMVGGTNGGHLTSFSLVDVLSHGRACALMNPYYTVFFAPNIKKGLKLVGRLYKEAGYTDADIDSLEGRELGEAVFKAMTDFQKKIGFPTKLSEVDGFTDGHIERALTAAKNPQLKMKLENMPQPLKPEMIDEYMGPILQAAKTGDVSQIKNVR